MSEEIANHSEESQEIERDAETEALYETYGLPQQTQEKKDIEFPKMEEPTDETPTTEESEEIQEETPAPEKRTLKLKYNGEDKEIDEDEARTLAQKGMNYDKVQQKLTEQQKALDEVAQLQGFKDHDDLIANLPKLREQQQQKEKDAYEQLRQDIRQQAEDAGLDPDQVEAYLNNNPLVKEAQKALQERDSERADREVQEKQQAYQKGWQELYDTFPDIVDDSLAFNEGKNPTFYTDEMKSLVEQGYKPLHAYKLAHMDKIQAQSKKSSQQQLIKQQQLGLRGHVNEQTAAPAEEGALLPIQVGLAEEFGVSLKEVQRQNKLLKNRR